MKRPSHYSPLSILLFLCITAVAQGQDKNRWRLGTTLGASLDIHQTSGIRWDEHDPQTPLLENITGFGGSLGVVAEYRLSSSWGIGAHFNYTSGSARFTEPTDSPPSFATQFYSYGVFEAIPLTPDPNDPRAEAAYEYRGKLRYQRLDFDLLLERKLFGNNSTVEFSAAAGPVVFYFADVRHDRWLRILQDKEDGIIESFTDNSFSDLTGSGFSETHSLPHTDPAEEEQWHYGIRGGFSATFGALNGRGIVASPGLYFDYGLTNLVDAPASWKMISLTGRLDITVAL